MTSEFFLIYSGTVAVLILVALASNRIYGWIAARWQDWRSRAGDRRERRRLDLVTGFRRGR